MSRIDDLEKIEKLKNKGILTQEEFENEKNKILGYQKNNVIAEDLRKIEELKNKGILTLEEFEKEKNKILNNNKQIVEQNNSNVETAKTQTATNEENTSKKKLNKKLFIIIGIIIVVIIIGIILIIINNNKLPVTENETSNNITDTNLNNEIENSEIVEDEFAIHSNLKYNLKDYNKGDYYLIFENNQFEIYTYMEDMEIYMWWGDYFQDMENITFNVTKVGNKIENQGIIGVEYQETLQGTISTNGENINILSKNGENLVFELSDQYGIIHEITTLLNEEDLNQQTSVDTTTPSNNENTQNTNNTSGNKNTQNTNNTSSNNNTKKEMVEVPWFSYLGNSLEYYTTKLEEAGISYKIVKEENLNYENDSIIEIEHNGERIEKGTTISIKIADNTNHIYDMEVWVNTGYLLDLAGVECSNDEVNISLKINGTSICNGKFQREDYPTSPIQVGNYKGKKDNLKFDITIEGKKITKTVNYIFKDSLYSDKPAIVIYKGGDMGPLG